MSKWHVIDLLILFIISIFIWKHRTSIAKTKNNYICTIDSSFSNLTHKMRNKIIIEQACIMKLIIYTTVKVYNDNYLPISSIYILISLLKSGVSKLITTFKRFIILISKSLKLSFHAILCVFSTVFNVY